MGQVFADVMIGSRMEGERSLSIGVCCTGVCVSLGRGVWVVSIKGLLP